MQFETKYPHQIPLPVENELPFMESGIKDSPIDQRKLIFEQTPFRTMPQQGLNHFWSNDNDTSATADQPYSACNGFASPERPNLTYNCIREKMFYYINNQKN